MKEVYIRNNSLSYVFGSILSGMMILGAIAAGVIVHIVYGIGLAILAFWLAPGGESVKSLSRKRKRKLARIENSSFGMKFKNESVEYVSVFNQSISGYTRTSKRVLIRYDVNVWFEGNKHKKIYRTDDKLLALGVGRIIAKKLNVDCLNATNGEDRRWMNLKKAI